MKFGHFVPICIPETYQVTRFHCDIFIRLIRLKTEVEELVSQRTKEKAKRANRRVTPQERHFLVLEAANWPYCDNYERKLFPCIERGRTITSIRSNPRPNFAIEPTSSA